MKTFNKTDTLKAFEKKLKENGFDFEIVKQTPNETLYNVSKDDYKDTFIATNVLDKKIFNWKMFELNYSLQKQYHDRTGKWMGEE